MSEDAASQSLAKCLTTDCCIAGGGPAGMMLGYILARVVVTVVLLPSYFKGEITIATNNGSAGHLASLLVRGSLGAKKLGNSDLNHLAGYMTYDFVSNPAIEFGGHQLAGLAFAGP